MEKLEAQKTPSEAVYKLQVEHFRFIESAELPGLYNLVRYRRSTPPGRPLERGGVTRVNLTLADGQVFQGVAVCSLKDGFSYRMGRQIAVGRAVALARKAGYLV